MSADPATLGTSEIRYPSAPDGFTIYVVGDVHGCLDPLVRVQRLIDEDRAKLHPERTAEIYLGDYIDRGPDSAGVVSRLIARARDANAVFLRGNHDQMLLDFLDGADCLEQWRELGGTATLLSYGVAASLLTRSAPTEVVRDAFNENMPPEHRVFYDQTGSYMQVGPYLMVHAGIRPGVGLEDQKTADLLGIRQDFLQYDHDFDFIVVHGHTPVEAPDLRRNRINIDTGAFATNRLTCLRIGEDGPTLLEAQ
jgi:serine/threonine protein phosphatase 1